MNDFGDVRKMDQVGRSRGQTEAKKGQVGTTMRQIGAKWRFLGASGSNLTILDPAPPAYPMPPGGKGGAPSGGYGSPFIKAGGGIGQLRLNLAATWALWGRMFVAIVRLSSGLWRQAAPETIQDEVRRIQY